MKNNTQNNLLSVLPPQNGVLQNPGIHRKPAARTEELKAAVMAYEHPGLILRLKDKLGLSESEAIALFDDTKRFLWMCAVTSGQGFAPAPKIDEGWHNFILFTQEYADFCQRFFGGFLHHVPKVNGKKEVPQSGKFAIERTLVFARKAFGELSANWKYRPDIIDCGGCGPASCCEKCLGTTND